MTVETMCEAYENSPSGSVLRKLIMREVVDGLAKKRDSDFDYQGYDHIYLDRLGAIEGFASHLMDQFGHVLHSRDHHVSKLYVEDLMVNEAVAAV